MESTSHSTSDMSFRSLMPAISQFDSLGLKPERSENLSKTFIFSISQYKSG